MHLYAYQFAPSALLTGIEASVLCLATHTAIAALGDDHINRGSLLIQYAEKSQWPPCLHDLIELRAIDGALENKYAHIFGGPRDTTVMARQAIQTALTHQEAREILHQRENINVGNLFNSLGRPALQVRSDHGFLILSFFGNFSSELYQEKLEATIVGVGAILAHLYDGDVILRHAHAALDMQLAYQMSDSTAADNPGNRLKRQAIDAVKDFFREPNLQVQSTARWLAWHQEHYPDGRPFGESED